MRGELGSEARREDGGAAPGDVGGAFARVWGREFPRHHGRSAADEYVRATTACVVVDHDWRGVLDLSGERAADLVGRLLTRWPPPSAPGGGPSRRGVDAALLSAKGRLIAAFQAHQLGPVSFRLVLPEPMREFVTTAFGRYAFLDDVAVENRAGELGIVALLGPRAADVLSAVGAGVPGALLECRDARVAGVDVEIVRSAESGAITGFELWVPRDGAAAVRSELLARAVAIGGAALGWDASEALRIEAGRTRWGVDYDDDCFPAEVHQEHRLSFDRCYVGQEVAARLRTYGHVNRRLVWLHAAAGSSLEAGARVLAGGEEAGRVTSVCESFARGVPLAIAMVKRKYGESDEVSVEGGASVVLTELPGREDCET